MRTTITAQIAAAHAECAMLNPHFDADQSRDWVFAKVFGRWTGSEADRRNMFLCR